MPFLSGRFSITGRFRPKAYDVLAGSKLPRPVKAWLVERLPGYTVQHASELGLSAALDSEVYAWASQHQAVIITFDYDFIEDFANLQTAGIIHLRANPTNRDNAVDCLSHLFSILKPEESHRALVIVKGNRIRVFDFP